MKKYQCQLCGEIYYDSQWFIGYCDNSLECAVDEAEHLVRIA